MDRGFSDDLLDPERLLEDALLRGAVRVVVGGGGRW